MGDGKWRMVPSGDIVDWAEYQRRLPPKTGPKPDCMGLTWEQIAMMQGGLSTLDITRRRR